MNKTRILFLCTGNSCRSQIAEAFMRKYAGDNFDVYSAGLEPKSINPFTIRVMNEKDMDMNGQYSKALTDFLGKYLFGYVITVCSNAEEKCPIFPGISVRLYWPFEDPAAFEGSEEEKLAKFREIRDQIEMKIKSWLVEQKILSN